MVQVHWWRSGAWELSQLQSAEAHVLYPVCVVMLSAGTRRERAPSMLLPAVQRCRQACDGTVTGMIHHAGAQKDVCKESQGVLHVYNT